MTSMACMLLQFAHLSYKYAIRGQVPYFHEVRGIVCEQFPSTTDWQTISQRVGTATAWVWAGKRDTTPARSRFMVYPVAGAVGKGRGHIAAR